jgi:hypothetical protein
MRTSSAIKSTRLTRVPSCDFFLFGFKLWLLLQNRTTAYIFSLNKREGFVVLYIGDTIFWAKIRSRSDALLGQTQTRLH